MKLTIKEKDYRLVWGLPAISLFCENVGHADDLEQAFELAFPSGLEKVSVLKTIKARLELIKSAIYIGAELDGIDVDFSNTELQAFVDDAEQSLMDDVFEDFFKSKYLGKSIENYLDFQSVEKEEDAPKKKSRQAS